MDKDSWLKFLFLFFLVDFFVKFYYLILNWLGITLHNLFWFVFYKVIMILEDGGPIKSTL